MADARRARAASLTVTLLAAIGVSASIPGLPRVALAQSPIRMLGPGRPVDSVLAADQPHAFALDLARGQFVRLVGTARQGTAFVRLLGPRGDTIQHTYVAVANPLPLLLSYTAREPGSHRLEIVRFAGDTATLRYELRVDELLSPAQYAARLDSLRHDPRVAWLARHVVPLRTISPGDDDFADLEPLRASIGEARIVLLGEESHASGTSLLALSRIVRFLHQRMGFGVIAFESGLYDMWKVSQRLQEGGDPADAFRQGMFGTWSKSEDFQPLVRYLGQAARGPTPLEITGVDIQLTGDSSRRQLISDLRETTTREGLAAEGREFGQGFWDILSRMADFYYFRHRDSLPERRLQEDAVSGLRWMAGRFAERSAARSGPEARALAMWAQVTSGLAELVAWYWTDLRGEREVEDRRDREMVRQPRLRYAARWATRCGRSSASAPS